MFVNKFFEYYIAIKIPNLRVEIIIGFNYFNNILDVSILNIKMQRPRKPISNLLRYYFLILKPGMHIFYLNFLNISAW